MSRKHSLSAILLVFQKDSGQAGMTQTPLHKNPGRTLIADILSILRNPCNASEKKEIENLHLQFFFCYTVPHQGLMYWVYG
jgi:hypothetical protein